MPSESWLGPPAATYNNSVSLYLYICAVRGQPLGHWKDRLHRWTRVSSGAVYQAPTGQVHVAAAAVEPVSHALRKVPGMSGQTDPTVLGQV